MFSPAISIGGNAATAFALVLHKLGTNAVKYGALSSEAGAVEIEWTIVGEQVRLEWAERGGPPLDEPPEEERFGSRLAYMSVTDSWEASSRAIGSYPALWVIPRERFATGPAISPSRGDSKGPTRRLWCEERFLASFVSRIPALRLGRGSSVKLHQTCIGVASNGPILFTSRSGRIKRNRDDGASSKCYRSP